MKNRRLPLTIYYRRRGVAPDVTGTVNVDIRDMPWDQALEQILRENGLAYRLQGNKMEVFKP